MQLNVRTEDNKYVIEANISVTSIYIKKDETIEFKKKGQLFSIEAKQVLSLAKNNVEDRIKIFYTTTSSDAPEEFVISDDMNLVVKGELTIEENNQIISLYVAMDNHLRFISNQLPSAASYFVSSSLKKMKANNDFLELEIECTSKILSMMMLRFIFKNRKNKETVSVSTEKIKTVFKSHQYHSTAHFKISINKLLPLLDHMEMENYDATILDTFIEPYFHFSKTTIRQFKVHYPSNVDDENWFLVNGNKLLLKSYGTTNTSDLAFRTTFLSPEVYNHYQTMKEIGFQKHSYSNRQVVLISEYPFKAQDNGLLLFQYLNKQHSDVLDCYYVITEKSADRSNLSPFEDKVIIFKSRAHFDLITRTDMILHTHSSNYALPLVTPFMEQYYTTIKKVFLQHGIIGERNLAYLYGKKENPTFTDKFVVSSKREKKIVENELHYNSEDILLTGLARFDKLLEGNGKELSYSLRKDILIMPSWRQGLEHLSDKEFMGTNFFKVFDELLNDPFFESLVNTNNLRVSFYLHPNFQKFSHLFHSKFISVLDKESNVQQLLKSHGVLITDFSSVGLDFSLLDRSVIYYQFDERLSESREGSKNFLPGPIVKTKKKLFKVLQKKIKNNSLSWKHKINRKRNLYLYDDLNARQRIFEHLMNFLKSELKP